VSWWPGNARKERTTFGALDRSALMARVRSTGNETTELRMARLLRSARVIGWRRHLRLPGKPDFAWPNQRVALFIDGCFWHGHRCGKNITPKTNGALWSFKIATNKKRDSRISQQLRRRGWCVLRVWECSLKNKPTVCISRIKAALSRVICN
jgi:DNA mismatch endonuclease (patch repair protein)